MQIDSGATISVINSKTYKEISRFLHLSLVPAPSLQTYTKEEVQVLGKCSIPVQHHSLRRTKFLEVVVVEDESVNNIMGTSWSDAFPKYFPPVKTVNAITRSVNEVTSRYPSLFRPIPGRYSSLKVDIDIDPQAVPKYFKARPLPLALQDKVKKRLEQHVEDGSLVRVSNAKWATPIVPVVNQDGSVRITGDYRLTLNPVTNQVQYPIPLTTDLFAKLSGGIIFSKIDLHSAYLQFQLSPESKHLTTINTTFGLFEYNCMPFGICSTSAIFQREMDKLFSGISGVSVFQDDIVCTGKTVHEHNETLNEVLSRLDSVGLTVKESKCRFGVDSVKYLGHIIDKDGLRPIPDRVEAIAAMPPPENVSQLKSLLGMINYYAHFIPRVSTVLAPMHQLLKKNKRWEWSASCQQAFDEVKKMLQSSSVLCHYSPTLPIRVTADSSSYGVGAVLSHVVKGEERPIFFASRTLTPAEHNYSQLDKEALAIIFAVKRFQQYLYCRKFEILTDHQPLVSVFSPDKPLSMQVPARMLRWKLILASHDYEIKYKKGSSISNADGLSRLPIQGKATNSEDPLLPNMMMLCDLPESESEVILTSASISAKSRTDPLLSRVVTCLRSGSWPSEISEDLTPFYSRREDLTIESDCLKWGSRLIVPSVFRSRILDHLHGSHQGIVKMKALARMYVWWPKMDQDIEDTCKACSACAIHQSMPPQSPTFSLVWPDKPWHRIHIDLAGPFHGKTYLVVIDAFSKWLEVIPLSSTSSAAIVGHLRRLIAQFGIPTYLVSDNGPNFISEEFERFCKQSYISHRLVSIYHPRSNGQAEIAVKHFKSSMKKITSSKDPGDALQKFLFSYRTTPHTTTGKTPAYLMFRRELRTPLAAVIPTEDSKVDQSQERQNKDTGIREVRAFAKDDRVYAKIGKDWIPGIVIKHQAPMTYSIRLDSDRVVKCHTDNLRKTKVRFDTDGKTHSEKKSTGPIKPILRRSPRLQGKINK